MLLPVVLFVVLMRSVLSNSCIEKQTQYGKVCVCNATYCDKVPKIGTIPANTYKLYTTSETNPGFSTKKGNLSKVRNDNAALLTVTADKLQTIQGFGGAFTDATGINIKSLSSATQSKLIESYFGESGIEYSLCRVPIGGTDFSPKPYSYDDVDGDVKLEKFALQEEDLEYKIPVILKAIDERKGKPLQLFGSAWTAPAWMKTNHTWTGYSFLKEDHYQVFTEYMKRFLEEYAKHGIDFWGLTTGNEPINGFYPDVQSKINAMAWLPQVQAKWISQNLGPTLRNSPFKDIKIMIHDDSKLNFPYVVPLMLDDQEALEYIDGVAVHWYFDGTMHVNTLDLVDYKAKNVSLLMTEACIFRENGGVNLGSWDRGARYMTSILEYLHHGSIGWIDWNMVLTEAGGPTYIGYPADSPTIADASKDEFYKQPMYYAMGHLSKFAVKDSVMLSTKLSLEGTVVQVAAFERPDKLKAVVIFNSGYDEVHIQIQDGSTYSDTIRVEGRSFNTVLYPSPATIEEAIYLKMA